MAVAILLIMPPTGIGGHDLPVDSISVEIVMLPAMQAAVAQVPIKTSTQASAQDPAPVEAPAMSPPPSPPEPEKPPSEPLEQPPEPKQTVAAEPAHPPSEAAAPPTVETAPYADDSGLDPDRPMARDDTASAAPPPSQTEHAPETAAAGAPRAPTEPAAAAPAVASSAAVQNDLKPMPVPSVSPGALRRFARDVARSLARSPPRRLRHAGVVLITFTVSATGALERVSIARSSGSEAIDDAARAAVRRTTFPRPPDGASAAQRSFSVPYEFRRN